jgi:hypothetical protein
MCTLSIGSVSIIGRERGASEENVITFISINIESSSHLVAIQTLLYIVTHLYTVRIQVAL